MKYNTLSAAISAWVKRLLS